MRLTLSLIFTLTSTTFASNLDGDFPQRSAIRDGHIRYDTDKHGVHLSLYRRGGRSSVRSVFDVQQFAQEIQRCEAVYLRTITEAALNKIVRTRHPGGDGSNEFMFDGAGGIGQWYVCRLDIVHITDEQGSRP